MPCSPPTPGGSPGRFPLETIERIAQRIPGTFDREVRFLERVAAFAGLEGKPASLEFLARGFPELAGHGERDVDLKALIELVSREFGASPEEIASNRKLRSAVLARHLVIYLATVVFNLKARRVMRHLGGLSPSTTAYARRKIEQRRKDDALFDLRVKRLLEELNVGQKLLF
ncbi:MAG: helix-turn-helix domain-containing protein [Planctomycetota bacterium]